jgi:acyl carrier protein
MEKREILNIIYSAIVECFPSTEELLREKERSGEHNFFLVDLGLNSIDYAEVVNLVMGKLNIDRPLDEFTHTNRVDEISDILCGLSQA